MNQNEIIINNTPPQNIGITQDKNQEIIIDGGSITIGITDVLVNNQSVVENEIAYVEVPTKTSELVNNSGFITYELDPTVPSFVKNITQADIVSWNSKQPLLVSGSNIKTINSNSLLGSGNIEIEGNTYTAGDGISIENNVITNDITSYNDLTDLPTIPTKTSDLVNDNDFVSENQLSDVAFSGSYLDLSNTPDIPTDVSELDNDVGYITNSVNDLTNYTLTSNLSSVALSGDYDDLINKPTIPTVNNGTLTIQVNGNTVNSFTANSSSNITTNITVPTTTNDLTNNSGFIDSTQVAIYSGTEAVIGKWIDNKPIYRKTFTTTGDSNNAQTILTLDNVDNVINVVGWARKGTDRRNIIQSFYNGGGWNSQFYFSTLYGGLGIIECGNDYASFKDGATIYTTIEYTKTTD